jgi:hypothetical protein
MARKELFGTTLPSVRPRRSRLAALVLVALAMSVSLGGCRACAPVVNASPGLRWWLFSNFGAQRICPEMLKQGVPLRMQDRGPTVGRYFPTGCSVDVSNERQTVTVSFLGTGYAYTPITRRVGFQCTASVELRPDFYLGEEDIYVWGRVNRLVNGPAFTLGYVENPVADVATSVTPLGTIANLFGNQIVADRLGRGFTVVQNWDTDSKTFQLGILMPPQKPLTPYDVTGEQIYTFSNETIEVQTNQMDFLGPFEIVDGDQQLLFRAFLQGQPVDLIVVSRATGDAWRDAYQQGRPLGAPPGPVFAGTPLQPTGEQRFAWRLPPGQYYVVVDNSPFAGSVAPPALSVLNPLGGPVARVSYVAQLGEL